MLFPLIISRLGFMPFTNVKTIPFEALVASPMILLLTNRNPLNDVIKTPFAVPGRMKEHPGIVELHHCTPGQEAGDVAAHLRAILAEPDAALTMGQRARAHALQVHSAAHYVDRLLPAIAAATEAAPAIAAARRLGKVLGRFDIGSNDPAVLRIVANLSDMLAL
jgi:hypothetical protein